MAGLERVQLGTSAEAVLLQVFQNHSPEMNREVQVNSSPGDDRRVTGQVETHGTSYKLCLELAHCHFLLIFLIKARHSPQSKGRERYFTFKGGTPSYTSKSIDPGRGEKLN